jgi:hypothetical protein
MLLSDKNFLRSLFFKITKKTSKIQVVINNIKIKQINFYFLSNNSEKWYGIYLYFYVFLINRKEKIVNK